MINLNDPQEFTLFNVARLLASVEDDGTTHQIRVDTSGQAYLSSEPNIGNRNLDGVAVYFESFTASGYVGVDAASDSEWVASVYQALKDNWPTDQRRFVDFYGPPEYFATRISTGLELRDPSAVPDLSAMTREQRVAEMVQWFLFNYEDPANSTPRDEGDYFYIWGGPYYAGDIIPQTFLDDVDEDEVDNAVAEIEAIGHIWVPNERRLVDDYQWSYPDVVGKKLADLKTGAIKSEVARARSFIDRLQSASVGMGHNNPPEELEELPLDQEELEDIARELETIEEQAQSQSAVTTKLWRALTAVGRMVGRVLSWFGGLIDTFAKEFAKSAGKTAGPAAVAAVTYANWDGLVSAAVNLLGFFF
ncbi:hypothetical protein [Ponticaulis koreensis]|uniref:hypothetical protein n=1 Tax=Ponticaulis koreensis TaxID=1123045 RepID=UPI0003B60245|nr:hypothetical protein [Ponticaulis koreensis]